MEIKALAIRQTIMIQAADVLAAESAVNGLAALNTK